MLTVIIDIEIGNLHSAEKAFGRIAHETEAGQVAVVSDAETVARADRIVLPGDGAFPSCAAALRRRPDLLEAMREAVTIRGRPFLGICVGMQLMASRGLENGETDGLGWIKGEVTRLAPKASGLKIPHMGWNDLVIERPHPVLNGIVTGDHAYFVHSYHFNPHDPADRLAYVDYGGNVTAIIGRDTMLGTQFHPEKSHATGLRLIADFLAWRP